MTCPSMQAVLDSTVAALDDIAATTLGMENGSVPLEASLGFEPANGIGAHVALVVEGIALQVGLITDQDGLVQLTSAMLGLTPGVDSLTPAEQKDALGELSNMLAGGVKARISKFDPGMRLGLPMVIRGTVRPTGSARCLDTLRRLGSITVRLLLIFDEKRT